MDRTSLPLQNADTAESNRDNSVTRRRFLKRATCGTAGLALALNTNRPLYAAPPTPQSGEWMTKYKNFEMTAFSVTGFGNTEAAAHENACARLLQKMEGTDDGTPDGTLVAQQWQLQDPVGTYSGQDVQRNGGGMNTSYAKTVPADNSNYSRKCTISAAAGVILYTLTYSGATVKQVLTETYP